MNVILRGTTEHLSHDALRTQFEVSTCEDLAAQITLNRKALASVAKYP